MVLVFCPCCLEGRTSFVWVFGYPHCPAWLLSKNQGAYSLSGNRHLVTAGPCQWSSGYLHRSSSICLSAHLTSTGLQDLCSISSLAKQEKYQIGHACKVVQPVADLGVQINICSCIHRNEFSVTISTALAIICVLRPQILVIESVVCAHKSGKDLTWNPGMALETFLVLAGYSLISVKKTVNWLRLIATVEGDKQLRLKIQLCLIVAYMNSEKHLTFPKQHLGSTTDTAQSNVIYSFWRSLQTSWLKLKAKLHVSFQTENMHVISALS